MPKNDIESQLRSVGFSSRFIELWWDLEILGLGRARPVDVYRTDPARLLEYVMGYSVDSQSRTA